MTNALKIMVKCSDGGARRSEIRKGNEIILKKIKKKQTKNIMFAVCEAVNIMTIQDFFSCHTYTPFTFSISLLLSINKIQKY